MQALRGNGVITNSQPPGGPGNTGGFDGGGITYTHQNPQTAFQEFFGPSKGPIETLPSGSYRRENFALPDAYRGSNSYLTNVIITLVTEQARGGDPRTPPPPSRGSSSTRPAAKQDLWPVKIALPWRLTESEMEIAWDQIIFDNTLLGQVPEEGVSRLVTQQVSERRDHYIRYGLAFMLEHGFMKTERGRLCYRMNLEQIRNAILETAYLGVLNAYLQCKQPSFMGSIRAGMQRLSQRGLAKALQQEVEQFAMIQKSEYGFDVLDALGKRALKLLGVTPNLWIVPEGMKMYLNLVRKENFQALIAGDTGLMAPIGSRSGQRAVDVVVDVAKDCAVVETKSFELPSESDPIDPMQRAATIGEYYTMFNHLRGNVSPKDYRTSWRDIFIYNEDKDGFTRISLDMAIASCARFPNGNERKPLTLDANHEAYESGKWGNGVPPDMFLCSDPKTGNAKVVDFMGDMHSQYLRDAGLNDWAESFIAKTVLNDPQMLRALRDGIDLCNRIDKCAIGDDTTPQGQWYKWLAYAQTTPRATYLEAGGKWNDEHDIPEPMTFEEYLMRTSGGTSGRSSVVTNFYQASFFNISPGATTVTMKVLPVGYANYAGMSVLADPKYANVFGPPNDIHSIAKNFKQAFDALYSDLHAHTHNSVFMDGNYSPPWFNARDGHATLFSNIIHVSHGPIWFEKENFANGGVSTKANANTTTLLNFIYETSNMWWEQHSPDQGKKLNPIISLVGLSGRYFDELVSKFETYLKENIGSIKGDDAIKDEAISYATKIAQLFTKKEFNQLTFYSPITDSTSASVCLVVRALIVLVELINTKKETLQKDFAESGSKLTMWIFHQLYETLQTSVQGFICELANIMDFFKFADAKNKKVSAWTSTSADEISLSTWLQEALAGRPAVTNGVVWASDALDTTPKLTPKGTYGSIDTDVFDRTASSGQVVRDETVRGINWTPTSLTAGHHQDIAGKVYVGTDPTSPNNTKTFINVPPLIYFQPALGGEGAAAGGAGTKRVADERLPFGAKRLKAIDPLRYAEEQEDDPISGDPWGNKSPVGIDFTDSFRERFHRIESEDTDTLRRLAKLVFLGQPAVRKTFDTIIAHDDVFPFGFLIMRPYMTYQMASAILTVAGASTGETLVGHADFQLADNVVQKMHIGNFTMYLKSVVYQPQQVWIADNIMACGYVAGNNCVFANEETDGPPTEPAHASLYACLLPYDSQQQGDGEAWMSELPNPLDTSGQFDKNNPMLAPLAQGSSKWHYASAPFYSKVYKWDHSPMDASSMGTDNRYNSVVFQGHEALYNPSSQRYDIVIECTGHRGNRVYAGCGRVWKGLAKLLEPVNHSTTHGGAPLRTITTIGV